MEPTFNFKLTYTTGLGQKIWRSLQLPLMIAACMGGIAWSQTINLQRLQANASRDLATYQQRFEQTRLQLKTWEKLAPYSFRNLTASWSFLQFMQHFGDTPARNQTGYALTPEFFQFIVNRDPRFLEAYFYLSPANTLYAGRPELSVQLIGRGLGSFSPKIHPDSYYLWFYKAADQILFLGDTPGAKQSYEMAARWASQVNTPHSLAMAASARDTTKFLARNPNSKRARANAWAILLTNAVDAQTQMLAARQIKALGGQVYIEQRGNMRAVRVRLPEE
jgi:hypothetical protein